MTFRSRLSQSKLVTGATIAFAVRLVNVLANFALTILLVRELGLQGFGIYGTYMALLTLAVLPITSGIPNLIVRETSPAFADGDYAKVRGVIAFLLSIFSAYLCTLFVAGLATYLLAPEWASTALFLLIWPHAFFQALAAIRSAVLRSAGLIVRGQLLERLVQPVLTLVFNGVAVLLLGEDFAVAHSVIAMLIAHGITLAWGGLWVRHYALGPGERSSVNTRRLWREGLHLSGSGLAGSVMFNGIVLLISTMASLEAVGIYRIASSVAVPVIYVHEVLNQVVAPSLARHRHTGNQSAEALILRIGVMASFGTVTLLTVMLAFVGEKLLLWAYGPESTSAFLVVIILALSHCANAAGGFRDLLLNMSGHSHRVFGVTLTLATTTIAIAFLGIILYGALGAAFALLFYQLSASVWLSIITYKVTRHDPSILGVFTKIRTI